MAARGLVAFLGGAATKQSEILDEQRRLKQEEERQRLLLRLREEAEIRAANHADKLARKRTDRNFSGPDGDYYIYRDNDGNETHRRELTADEKAARAAAADAAAWERDYKERQLALQRRGQDISAANSRRAAASRGRDGDEDSARPKSLEDQMVESLMASESDIIADYTKSRDIPLAEIKHMALETVMSATSRADTLGSFDEQEMRNDFFNRMRRNYNNVTDPKYNNRRPVDEPSRSPSTYTHVSARGRETRPYTPRD